MSRVPHTPRGGNRAALLAGTTAGATAPAVPDTMPLPSDETAAPAAPVVGAAPIGAPVVTETAPLPVPGTAPRDVEEPVVAKPPLVEVDSTIPLPSDQMTPLVSPVGTTDVSATTRAAIAAEGAAADRNRNRDDLEGDPFWDRLVDEDRIKTRGRVDKRPSDDAHADLSATRMALVGRGGEAFDLLREQLDSAGFGVVILTAETVDALRDALGMAPLTIEQPVDEIEGTAVPEERRRFMVSADVHHDRKHVKPGGYVVVTRAEFDRYRAGTSIAATTDWWDGKVVG